MKTRNASLLMMSALTLLVWLPSPARAQAIAISLSDPQQVSGGTGFVTVETQPSGLDLLSLEVANLEPNQEYTVFLAASPAADALPVQFLGSLRTAFDGSGVFSAVTEVFDAYAAANPGRTDSVTGVAPSLTSVPTSPARAIPLDWIRVYRARPISGVAGTVFGTDGMNPGGPHTIATKVSFNGDAPLRADAGPDKVVSAPNSVGEVVHLFLDGGASSGDIRQWEWVILESDLPSLPFAGCSVNLTSGFFATLPKPGLSERFNPCNLLPSSPPVDTSLFTGQPLKVSQVGFRVVGARDTSFYYTGVTQFVDFAGRFMTVRLIVTDLAGNRSLDTVTVRFQ